MVTHLHQSLGELIRVDVQKSLEQLVRNAHVRVPDVFESVKQNIVSVLVVTKFLLLSCDVDCDPDSLTNVTDSSVELEGPLRLLWSVISFAHQVVN